MKYFNNIKHSMLLILLAFASTCFVACKDDIELAPTGNYDNIEGTYGSVKNITGARDLSTISIFGSKTGTGQLYFELTEKATQAVSVKFKVDKDALDAYNTTNGTSYQMYSEAQVSIENDGVANIAVGSQKSNVVNVTITSNGGVGNTYALPISAEVTVGGVTVSKGKKSYIYLIKPYNAIPSSDKGTGIKSVLYMEVNDENILNAGEFTMAGSGKPFFDVVNIFAANINYDTEKKRAYIYCNENVANLLKNADKFIRPLQAKGIKVCLTILGNHDEAGVANLSDEAAADFAQEIKSYMDVYGLDGVDFDDEYSKYKYINPSPGFVVPSREAISRLIYECRKSMPDKIISVYDYSDYVPDGSFDGQDIGTYFDYAYWGAYANWDDRSEFIPGLGTEKYGPSSFNLDFSTSKGGCNLTHCQRLRTENYGIQMFYNMKAVNYDYSKIFNKVGNVLFDDNVEWTGKVYAKNDAVAKSYYQPYEAYLGTWTLTPAQGLYWYTPGPWWDWKNNVTYTLRIEPNVVGKSYLVYGWGETGNDLPLVMDYTSLGRIEINLPQTVKAPNGSEWKYVAKVSYSISASRIITDNVSPAFTGYINGNGNISIRSQKYNFTTIKTLAPIQWTGGNYIDDIYGGLYQDVAYEPYSLAKKN